MLSVDVGFHSAVPGEPSPPRRAGSVRRTSTIDITVTAGPRPRLHLEGRARDLRTTSAGDEVLDRATLSATIDLQSGTLTELTVTPGRWQEPLQNLVGGSARSGFRRILAAEASELTESDGPLPLLLDDLPVCVLVSGALRSAATGATDSSHPPTDVCAGWQLGGRFLELAAQAGGLPLVLGPTSGQLADPKDPTGWHEVPPLGEWSMRRARRLDLVPNEHGSVRALAYLRDVRRLTEPTPRIVHEYSVTAKIDNNGVVHTIDAMPHVLPAPECPQAVASSQRLAGRNVADLREHVTKAFVGVSTCTHLNDVLRALGDTHFLLKAVRWN